MARRLQLQGQPGFSRSLFIPVAGEPVAAPRIGVSPGAGQSCRDVARAMGTMSGTFAADPNQARMP